MDERRLIHESIDARLSGMTGDPWRVQRVLRDAQTKEVHMKRKVSASLILALVLMLAAVTAVAAALLSVRQVVEDYALPMADEVVGDSYTIEQTDELVRLAEENGIELSDYAKDSIRRFRENGEGYFKDELLIDMAKAEFGENLTAWTLEQQNWFDDVCVAIGFMEKKGKSMPEGGNDAASLAIQAADDYIHQTYDAAVELHDAAVYGPTGVQYILADEQYDQPYYAVDYRPARGSEAALMAAEYWVYLDDDFRVLGDHVTPGAVAGVHFMWIRDAFEHAYGTDYSTWSQSTLRAFRDAMLQAIRNPESCNMQLCMEKSSYPDIAPEAIPREEAIRLALAHLGLPEAERMEAYYLGAASNPVWRVLLPAAKDNRYVCVHAVEIDSLTGEVLCTADFDRWYWNLGLCTEKTRKEAQEEYDAYLATLPENG